MTFRGAGFETALVVTLIPALLGLYALVDAIRRPRIQWTLANQHRSFWITLLALGLVLWGLGLVVDLVYLLSIRRQLDRSRVQHSG